MNEATLIAYCIVIGVALFAAAFGLQALRKHRAEQDDILQRKITPTLEDAEESVRRIKALKGWKTRKATRFYIRCLNNSAKRYREATAQAKAATRAIETTHAVITEREKLADQVLKGKRPGGTRNK